MIENNFGVIKRVRTSIPANRRAGKAVTIMPDRRNRPLTLPPNAAVPVSDEGRHDGNVNRRPRRIVVKGSEP
jgi:hypothetical protein